MTKVKGSIALEESLARLVKNGHLEREDAMEFAVHPDEVEEPAARRGVIFLEAAYAWAAKLRPPLLCATNTTPRSRAR